MARFCSHCGTQLPAGARFCGNCGTSINQAESTLERQPEDHLRQDDSSQEAASSGHPSAALSEPAPQVDPVPLGPPKKVEQVISEPSPPHSLPPAARKLRGRFRSWVLRAGGGVVGLLILLAVVGALAEGSSSPSNPDPSLRAPEPQPGVVSGSATDAQGNPLSNVDISVKELNGAFSQDTTTDDQGNYIMEVDDGNYSVDAEVDAKYNGQYYRFPLYPKDDDNSTEEPASEGIVEDFVWKISGPRPGVDPNSEDGADYYGGSVQHIYLGDPAAGVYNTTQLPEGSTVQIAFAPDGPLIDGSEGETLSSECTIDSASVSGGDLSCPIVDIPLGQYAVTAIAVSPDGGSVPLSVGVSNIENRAPEDTEMASSALLQFQPFEADTYIADGVVPVDLYILP